VLGPRHRCQPRAGDQRSRRRYRTRKRARRVGVSAIAQISSLRDCAWLRLDALDIVAVTRHADSLRRVENLYPMIRTSGIPATGDLRRKLMEIKAAS